MVVFLLEMFFGDLIQKVVFVELGIFYNDIWENNFMLEQWEVVVWFVECEEQNKNFWIEYVFGVMVGELYLLVCKLICDMGVRFFVVDYVQFVQLDWGMFEENVKMLEMIFWIYDIVMKFGFYVFLLLQFKKLVQGCEGDVFGVMDLFYGMKIENVLIMIIMVYWCFVEGKFGLEVEMYIVKNWNGMFGEDELIFDGVCQWFLLFGVSMCGGWEGQ